jgi:hypothetical protein
MRAKDEKDGRRRHYIATREQNWPSAPDFAQRLVPLLIKAADS